MWSDLLLGVIHIKINYQGTASHPSSSLLCLAVTSQFLCKHWIIMIQPICSFRCVCTPFFLDCPTPPPFFFFCIPSPTHFQHLCWVHARASDKALCVPSLGNLPCFSSWLPAPPSWKPHNCLPFSRTLQSLSKPVRPLKLSRRTQVETQNGPRPRDPHHARKGEAVPACGALRRRWRHSQGEQPVHNVISHFAALGHEIKRGIHCRSLKSFLWSVSWPSSCLNSLTSPPFI